MAKYRPKACFYIEAVEYIRGKEFSEIPEWLKEAIQAGDIDFENGIMQIVTEDSYKDICPGCMVIKFLGGRIGVKTKEEFFNTYERIVE